MNFQQLEYCIAVKKQKHFGKAAESCNITQATLSGMIKKLELELNVTLFDRSKHPIKVTEDGIELLRLAEEVLETQAKMFAIEGKNREMIEGELNLGIIPTVANSLLPIILPRLLKKNPTLKLNVSEITTEEILHQLSTDQIDLGILSTPLPNLEYHISQKLLYHERLLVYGATNSEQEFISVNELKENQIWLLEEGHCFRNQTMAICDLNEDAKSNGQLNFKGNSFETLLNLSDQFGGYTLIPELYIKQMNQGRQKRIRAFQAPIPVREISLISLRPIAFKKTIELLTKEIQQALKAKLSHSDQEGEKTRIIEM